MITTWANNTPKIELNSYNKLSGSDVCYSNCITIIAYMNTLNDKTEDS